MHQDTSKYRRERRPPPPLVTKPPRSWAHGPFFTAVRRSIAVRTTPRGSDKVRLRVSASFPKRFRAGLCPTTRKIKQTNVRQKWSHFPGHPVPAFRTVTSANKPGLLLAAGLELVQRVGYDPSPAKCLTCKKLRQDTTCVPQARCCCKRHKNRLTL